MTLPSKPPIEPMRAELTSPIPAGANVVFGPKWDGFRALVFRDGDDVVIQSRGLEVTPAYEAAKTFGAEEP